MCWVNDIVVEVGVFGVVGLLDWLCIIVCMCNVNLGESWVKLRLFNVLFDVFCWLEVWIVAGGVIMLLVSVVIFFFG